jgi:hypothetical protein
METWTLRHEIKILNGKTEALYRLLRRKFVVCPFVDKEIYRSYPFTNALNRLAHLC